MKYRVGDKVRIVNHRNPWWNTTGMMDKWMGKVMTIRNVFGNDTYEMEEDVNENCGIGWGWSGEDFAELIPNPVNKDKIVITHNGKTTTATLYREDGGKEKATARCAPEDTFDFNVGATLAMERLMEKVEAPKYYNGKVVCVANEYKNKIPISNFTVGKIYEVTNGRITNDTGFTSSHYRSVEALCGGMGNEFIPYVE